MVEWTTPYTWTDGEIPNAAQFNQQIKNNLLYLYENSLSHFSKHRIYIPWVSGDGFTTSIAGDGDIDYNGFNVKLFTPTGDVGTVYIRSTGTLGAAFVTTGKSISIEWSFQGCVAITAQNILFVLTTSTTAPTAATASHIGFKIANADISSTSGDGASGETADTAVDIATGTALKRLRSVFTPGTDCKFYVDDILKTTHTTYLPAAAADLYLALMITNTAAVIKDVTVGRVLIERNYQMSFLYEHFNTGDNNTQSFGNGTWLGQSFPCNYAHTIVSIKLLLHCLVPMAGTISVFIRNADANGRPLDGDLCGGTLDASLLTTTPTWYEVSLGAGYLLTSGNDYVIVIGGANQYQYPMWRLSTADAYPGGGASTKVTGSGWTGNPINDHLFEEYGTENPSGADVDINVPLCTITDVTAQTPILVTGANIFQSIPRYHVKQLVDDDNLNAYLKTNLEYLKTLEETSGGNFSDHISWVSPDGFDLETYPAQSEFGGVSLKLTGSGEQVTYPAVHHYAIVRSKGYLYKVLQDRQIVIDFALLYINISGDWANVVPYLSVELTASNNRFTGRWMGVLINSDNIYSRGSQPLYPTPPDGDCFIPIRIIYNPGKWCKYFINNQLVWTENSPWALSVLPESGTALKLRIQASAGITETSIEEEPYFETTFYDSVYKISRVLVTQEYQNGKNSS